MTSLLANKDLEMAMIIEDGPGESHFLFFWAAHNSELVQSKIDQMKTLDQKYMETMERTMALQNLLQQTLNLWLDKLKLEIQQKDARILELEAQQGN